MAFFDNGTLRLADSVLPDPGCIPWTLATLPLMSDFVSTRSSPARHAVSSANKKAQATRWPMVSALPPVYPSESSTRSICPSFQVASRLGGSGGRCTPSIGFSGIHFHSFVATVKTFDSSVHSRLTVPGLTFLSRPSRHLAMCVSSSSSSGTRARSSFPAALRRSNSQRSPSLPGDTSAAYLMNRSPTVLLRIAPMRPTFSSDSIWFAQACASALVVQVLVRRISLPATLRLTKARQPFLTFSNDAILPACLSCAFPVPFNSGTSVKKRMLCGFQ